MKTKVKEAFTWSSETELRGGADRTGATPPFEGGVVQELLVFEVFWELGP